MKVLIYGGKGWIASQFIEEFKNQGHQPIVSDLHIYPNTIQEVINEVRTIDPDRIFCCLGRTAGFDEVTQRFINNIDYLENHLKENMNDNLYSPLMLTLIGVMLQKHVSYMGTGCIFNEDTREENAYAYKETDIPDFFGSGYSIVKGYTDQILKSFENVLNFRIRMPIVKEEHAKNFITKIFSYPNIHSMPNSMTYLPNLIPIMVDMCIRGINGTINCVNKGVISHKEIFDLYEEITGMKHNYDLIDEIDLDGLLKSKRSNNILDTTKLESYVQIDNKFILKDIKDCIREVFESYKGEEQIHFELSSDSE
jgi:3,5-epimerase/4-reductase